MTESLTIRSYQRIFRPDRRLYQIDGHQLPVPGGVPLRWLAFAIGALLAVVALSLRSPSVILVAAVVGGLVGAQAGGRDAAIAAAVGVAGVVWAAGFVVSTLDWPLRFVVMPALAATVCTQATPDARRADRFAASWLLTRLARRRSIGRALAAAGRRRVPTVAVWVAPDERGARPGPGRVQGPATLAFAGPVVVRRDWRRRVLVEPATVRPGRGAVVVESLALGPGEVAVVRP